MIKVTNLSSRFDTIITNHVGSGTQILTLLDDMAAAYGAADLVVCRSGALTIAELAAAGVGALLVPYPYAVDDHQTANARFVAAGEAGLLLPQSELTAEKLASVLGGLNRDTCRQWAQNARRMAKPDSAAKVAEAALAAVGG